MRVFMAVGAAVSRGITPYGQYVLQDIFAGTPHPHLYGTMLGIGYPPPWGLITGLMYSFSSTLAPNDLYAYVLALKIPIILAEIATAILIYNILKVQTNEKVASKAFTLFLFCPFILAVGTVWGMFDILALFFTLLSAYGLHSNWRFSSLYLSIASVLKVFPFTLAPLYSLLIYKSSRNLKTALSFFLLTTMLAGFFTITPMVVFGWPISNLYNALIYHTTTTSPS
jgi:predicted membrane-bound dolichyl-phosphate-mannose-protein mannosyltransferase